MFSTIQKDYFRIKGKWVKYPQFKDWGNPCYIYVYLFRKCSASKKSSFFGLFYRILKIFYAHFYGFQIPNETKIGPGFYIGHYGTIVINGEAQIGKNCNITHGVTIGQTNRGEKKGNPTIGDNVWIGTNAVIVGGIIIGNNVLIAPNSYVTENIPDNSIVIGNPIKIIPNLKATESYIDNRIE